MQKYKVETDEMGRQLNAHGDSFFPLAVYDKYFTDFVLKEVPWHWHEEIEIVVVYEGETKVEFVDGFVHLKEGEAVFINSNSLHRLTKVNSEKCRIKTFVLMAEFIGGRYDSRIFSQYIQPICSNQSISAIKFTPNIEWKKLFIKDVKEAFDYFSQSKYGYEINVRSKLTDAWLTLAYNIKDTLIDHSIETEDKRRINLIIKYIHSNYENKMSIASIADVANISESECYRLFNRTLQTTPNTYILNYRLQIAAIKLVESDDSIISLAQELGFASPSYFSKKFKARYNLTPRQFRLEGRQ